VQIRYYIDPATDLPDIYNHDVSEHEVEDILARSLQDIRGREDSRIALGQTGGGRYVKVIYVPDPIPESVFVKRRMSWVRKQNGRSAAAEGENDDRQAIPTRME
jgi:hypothetical protein